MEKHVLEPIRKYSIWLVVLCALVLRLAALDRVPPSPSLDEVSLGYNAYSLLRTGMDEFGTRYPIILRAYDDFRPALYVYVIIPTIALLGLTPFAVRLPSVLLSVATIWATYHLVKIWFTHYMPKAAYRRIAEDVSLGTAVLLAISPWHIYLSRLGHEVNLGLATVVFALVLFFRSCTSARSGWLTASAVMFGLAFASYQSQKIIVPFLIFLLGVLFIKELWRTKRRELLLSITIGFLLVLPMTMQSLSREGMIRYTATSAFTESNPAYARDRDNFVAAKMSGNIVGQLMSYPKLSTLKIFTGNYISHFNIRWLFTGGPYESHKVPYTGLLYIWEFPLVVLGLVFFWRSPFPGSLKIFMAGWFLSAALPAAITTQAPHAMRAMTFLPLWQLLSAYAVTRVIERVKLPMVLGLTAAVMLSLLSLRTNYFQVFPKTQSDSFQYPLAQALPVVFTMEDGYKHIVVSNEQALYQSYMFYLFYGRVDPGAYQRMGGTRSGGFAERHTIGKYEFRPIRADEALKPDTLYVGNPEDFRTGTTIQEVRNLAGQTRIVIKTL